MILPNHYIKTYMKVCEDLAEGLSKDQSSRFGAVLVRPDKSIASTGINGFPARVYDDPEKLGATTPELRAEKYARIVHAEANCLDHNRDYDTNNYTLLVNGPPCAKCALRVVNTGIKDLYFIPASKEFEERWADDIKMARNLFHEAGVNFHKVEL